MRAWDALRFPAFDLVGHVSLRCEPPSSHRLLHPCIGAAKPLYRTTPVPVPRSFSSLHIASFFRLDGCHATNNLSISKHAFDVSFNAYSFSLSPCQVFHAWALPSRSWLQTSTIRLQLLVHARCTLDLRTPFLGASPRFHAGEGGKVLTLRFVSSFGIRRHFSPSTITLHICSKPRFSWPYWVKLSGTASSLRARPLLLSARSGSNGCVQPSFHLMSFPHLNLPSTELMLRTSMRLHHQNFHLDSLSSGHSGISSRYPCLARTHSLNMSMD